MKNSKEVPPIFEMILKLNIFLDNIVVLRYNLDEEQVKIEEN